ncbi:glucosamine-6-phosphate deaminase [Paramagnetospirillum kuznetsovii]|uniref:Glucosamine-6-phosphate deaminase n=1 Tax=Paramagnetospirillum kuznetsovii TaxID=2053833 RepID=A0A364NYH0_9PROT|nr:glucosamine-6-phosphate deaminase [Paramagnetospirillum kuznetsovii]RAU22128.1 glucosamine-6-phosphate deaminase [Paramagnetospirillum kuznetsovii]
MSVIILPDARSLSLRAADLVEALVRRKPKAVIGLAAGATPQGMYAELIRRHGQGLDFSGVTLFGLDEYFPIAADHPASCGFAIRRHFIDQVALDPAKVHLVPGNPEGDPRVFCAEHEERITQAGGLDLQILGLGGNGHMGFNEPGTSLVGRTHLGALHAATRAANRPGFSPDEEVPHLAITMGIATILSARQIMLLATGTAKADAAAKAVEGPVTAMVPASALQLHPDATIMLDEAAAAKLCLRAEYLAAPQRLAEAIGKDQS